MCRCLHDNFVPLFSAEVGLSYYSLFLPEFRSSLIFT